MCSIETEQLKDTLEQKKMDVVDNEKMTRRDIIIWFPFGRSSFKMKHNPL